VTDRSGPAGSAPSILHRDATTPDDHAAREREGAAALARAADLHLDQVIDTLTKGREGYALHPLFHAPLADADAVAYRHEVFRDLDDEALRDALEAFSAALRHHREGRRRADLIRNPLQRHRLHLDGATAYVAAVETVSRALDRAGIGSRGLGGVAGWLRAYVASPSFTTLRNDARALRGELERVLYGLTVLEDRVHVGRVPSQHDYGADVERSFERFRRGPRAERAEPSDARVELDPVEAEVLDLVAQLHPDVFDAVRAFVARHPVYVDDTVIRFERELQFYLAFLAASDTLAVSGLRCCLPTIVPAGAGLQARDAFDLALALHLDAGAMPIVPNDVELLEHERALVVTGANQGGKSTYARAVGQLHHLAALGLPVPASSARLPLVDVVLTHFEGEDDLRTLQGKLQEELARVRDVLERATPSSVVIMNEAFSSTSGEDAFALGRSVLERLLDLGACTVYVTFVDELASFDPRVASVMATVDPVDGVGRTFRLERRPADGKAHAVALARAHGLTYEQLKRRLSA
jgi:DNA mismatch repair protein MutS